MGFMAGFGSGFADAFNKAQESHDQLKNTILSKTMDNWQNALTLRQKAKAEDQKNIAAAKALVQNMNGVPAGAWVNAYQLLSSGIPSDKVYKQIQTMQFGDPLTNGSTAPVTPTMDDQMKQSGLAPDDSTGKTAQPSIDPSLQDHAIDKPTGVDPQTMSDSLTKPASVPLGQAAMPVTETNNPETHPATAVPSAPMQPSNNGMPTLPNNPEVGENPIQTIGDRMKLAGQALFDPNARHELQRQQYQHLTDDAVNKIAAMNNMSPDEVRDTLANGSAYTPGQDVTDQPLPVTGTKGANGIDPKVMDRMRSGTLPARLKVQEAKGNAVDVARQLKTLDDIAAKDPAVLNYAGRGANAIQALTNEISGLTTLGKALIGKNDGNISEGELENNLMSNYDKFISEGGVGKLANDYRQFYAQAIRTAYALSKINTGGGGNSISDKDFEKNMLALVNSNSYTEFSKNIRETASQRLVAADTMAKQLLESPEGYTLSHDENNPKLSSLYGNQLGPIENDTAFKDDPSLYFAHTPVELDRGIKRWLNGGETDADTKKYGTPVQGGGSSGLVTPALAKKFNLPESEINKHYQVYETGIPSDPYRIITD